MPKEIRSSYFLPNITAYHAVEKGEISAESPSNIALVKYWGKKEVQIPINSSISFTLTKSKSITTLKYKPKEEQGYEVKVFLDGVEMPKFLDKIIAFFERIQPFMPFLQSYAFEIHTQNTFPHSAGIASSASGLSALTLCLLQLEEKIAGHVPEEDKLRKASFIARLGSGSACRSIYPGLVYWGENNVISGANKRYAIPYPYEIHPVYKNFRDTILLIDQEEKAVKSSMGHSLMDNHFFKEGRIKMAEQHIDELIPVFTDGDLEQFGHIIEKEALTLHALMLSSEKPFILIQPYTLSVINKIWEFRQETKLPLFFTIDAGANIHLLYPKNVEDEIKLFITTDLSKYCTKQTYIDDEVQF